MISKSRDARLKIIPWSFRHDDSVHFAPIEFPSTAMDPLTISQVAKLAGASGFSGDTSVRVNKDSTDRAHLSPANYSSRCVVKISMGTISLSRSQTLVQPEQSSTPIGA